MNFLFVRKCNEVTGSAFRFWQLCRDILENAAEPLAENAVEFASTIFKQQALMRIFQTVSSHYYTAILPFIAYKGIAQAVIGLVYLTQYLAPMRTVK